MIHFLNQHDPGSALVRNSSHINSMFRGFAVTQVYEAKKTKLVQFTFNHAIKADKKRKRKLIINVSLILDVNTYMLRTSGIRKQSTRRMAFMSGNQINTKTFEIPS